MSALDALLVCLLVAGCSLVWAGLALAAVKGGAVRPRRKGHLGPFKGHKEVNLLPFNCPFPGWVPTTYCNLDGGGDDFKNHMSTPSSSPSSSVE